MAAPNAGDERLVVVSNRLPLSLRKTALGWETQRSPGGLASALRPILADRGGLWIGWPGEGPAEPDPARDAELRRWEDEHGYLAVDLPRDLGRNFYEGYANQTLWPLFHQFQANVVFDPEGWNAYVEANRIFRDRILERLRPGDLVWIHDYHLMVLPQLLREAAPQARIGFFLHIPFPASEVFRILPRREELLRGLLGADFLAFQTYGDVQHLRGSLLRVLGVDSRMDRVEATGGFPRLAALPIGIAPDELRRWLDDPDARETLEDHRRRFAGRKVLLAVDRLDYTKGIPHRLRSFRSLLQRAPDLREQVVLLQVAVPSREKVPQYRRLSHDVSNLVGEINGELSTPGWTPIVYIRRAIPQAELAALYALADVAWVTPLRDGMNLVAKEYVACQRGGKGALVLSEFAGAAAEMGEAFLVNPWDEARTAEVVEQALRLPEEERRERMAALDERVRRNDVFAWARRFVEGLREATDERTRRPADLLQPLPLGDLTRAFREARGRLLLLDYDGTLVPFALRPRDATPPPGLVALIRRLGEIPSTAVVLISGRCRSDLDRWFGELRPVWLAAEHGALLRAPGTTDWQPLRPGLGTDWKARVRPVLEHFVDRAPGTFIEDKEFSMVWHHRMAHPDFGEWLANELVSNLEEMLAETALHALRGQKTVEVRLAWANKGEVPAHLEALLPPVDFRLALGDDRTDEDLFERLPADAWTVKVGPGSSRARFWVKGPAEARTVLERLIDERR